MLDIAVLSAATSLDPFFWLLQVLHPTQTHLRLVINIGDGRTDRWLLAVFKSSWSSSTTKRGEGVRSSEDKKRRGLSGFSDRQGQRTNTAKQLAGQFSYKRKTFRLILWKMSGNYWESDLILVNSVSAVRHSVRAELRKSTVCLSGTSGGPHTNGLILARLG